MCNIIGQVKYCKNTLYDKAGKQQSDNEIENVVSPHFEEIAHVGNHEKEKTETANGGERKKPKHQFPPERITRKRHHAEAFESIDFDENE